MANNPTNIDVDKLFSNLLASSPGAYDNEKKEIITNAYEFAKKAHSGVIRKSGEPYIIHPIAVAQIVSDEIGLGTKSIVASLLHDVIEDTDYTKTDIEKLYGEQVASIVEALTKISGVFEKDTSLQAENFKLLLMTLNKDLRVILIKIADRLHNMRTLNSMLVRKQYKIAAETLFLYAPIAKRLGLYEIKSELEELSFNYRHPEFYTEIKEQLEQAKAESADSLQNFITGIEDELTENNIKFEVNIVSRTVYSCWKKMQEFNIPFKDIDDLFSVRIVIIDDGSHDDKRQCWEVYTLVTDAFQPKPHEIQDWLSTPRSNGYRALHHIVYSKDGRAIEIQILTDRLFFIARKGFAAYRRKQGLKGRDSEIIKWLDSIKEQLDENTEAIEFVEQFRANLFSSEILLFTHKGHVRKLPKNSTILDFAYDIHSDLGNHCVGGKIKGKLLPREHILISGDKIEIVTAATIKAEPNWQKFVVTAKAKQRIRSALRKSKDSHIKIGKSIFESLTEKLKYKLQKKEIKKLLDTYSLNSIDDLTYELGIGKIEGDEVLKNIKRLHSGFNIGYWNIQLNFFSQNKDKEGNEAKSEKKDKGPFFMKENEDYQNFEIATCCSPIQGDPVIGFVREGLPVIIHHKDCVYASDLMTKHGNTIIEAKWTQQVRKSFLVTIEIKGVDMQGMVNTITRVISEKNNVNIRNINISAENGLFEGNVSIYVPNTKILNNLIVGIMTIKGIQSVKRKEINKGNKDIED